MSVSAGSEWRRRTGWHRVLAWVVGSSFAVLSWAQGQEPATSATLVLKDSREPEWIEYQGVVAARQAVHLIGLVPGKVKAVHVGAGQRVRKGQVLVELDTQDQDARVEAAQAQVSNAQAQREEAQSAYDRTAQLTAKGYHSAQTLERAKARLLGAQAAETAARAGLQEARSQRGYTVLKSPMDGVVTDKRVEPGDFSMPGLPGEVGFPSGRVLLTVFNPAALWLEARIPEQYARQVTVGAPARVRVPALDLVVEGRFVEVVPTVDAASRTFVARVDLPPDPALKLGMFGRAGFAVSERRLIRVPDSAVVRRGQLDTVFLRSDEGLAVMRVVRTGQRREGQIEILSGLKAGETLIVHPRADLRDGLKP